MFSILTSCGYKRQPDLILLNNSSTSFEAIYTSTSGSTDSVNIGSLSVGKELKSRFSIDDLDTSDGCYFIRALGDDGRVITKCFGYYTNGSSLNRGFKLIIENDTLLIDSW